MPHPVAYMPLGTYPDVLPDAAILAAAGFARVLGHALHVSTFSVDIPQVAPTLGVMLIDVPELVRAAEERSRAAAAHLGKLVLGAQTGAEPVQLTAHRLVLGGVADAAASEARYFDLSILPWTADSQTGPDLTQALVFGSGRPVVLVPQTQAAAAPDHLAIAWDESPVAARALGDALRLLPDGGRVSVLTVRDEKKLGDETIAETLAAALIRRGYQARAVTLSLDGKTIGAALQDRALAEGAGMLAMGGFGHSRLRDFVLGGATRAVLGSVRLPVLLSH
ncbi:MAG: universal stress protein [Paracoccaceae bacterium]